MGLRVGCGAQDITPSGQVTLAGHPYTNRLSSGAHNPLQATAVHIRSGHKGLIIVTLDLFDIDASTARTIRREVAKFTTMPEEQIFISCTHTHSGPSTHGLLCWSDDTGAATPEAGYMGLVCDRAVFAATHACATTRPAEVAWTTPDGNTEALIIREEGAGPVEAIVVISTTPPALLDERMTEMSPDLPLYLAKHLRARYGETLTVLYLTGAFAGETEDHRFGCCSFEEIDKAGAAMAETIARSIGELGNEDFSSDFVLSGKIKTVQLPLRQAIPGQANAKQRWSDSSTRLTRLRRFGDNAAIIAAKHDVVEARGIMNIAKARDEGTLSKWVASSQSADVQVVQVGQRFLAGMPGVLYAEYGQRLKETGTGIVHAVSLVNGDLQGYIVTSKAESAVKFGRVPSPYDCEAGEILLNTVFSMILS